MYPTDVRLASHCSLEQRVHVARTGLGDRSPDVVEAARKLLCKWLDDYCSGEVVYLLNGLGAEQFEGAPSLTISFNLRALSHSVSYDTCVGVPQHVRIPAIFA